MITTLRKDVRILTSQHGVFHDGLTEVPVQGQTMTLTVPLNFLDLASVHLRKGGAFSRN